MVTFCSSGRAIRNGDQDAPCGQTLVNGVCRKCDAPELWPRESEFRDFHVQAKRLNLSVLLARPEAKRDAKQIDDPFRLVVMNAQGTAFAVDGLDVNRLAVKMREALRERGIKL